MGGGEPLMLHYKLARTQNNEWVKVPFQLGFLLRNLQFALKATMISLGLCKMVVIPYLLMIIMDSTETKA